MQQPAPPRVACLLPSATEILGALDLAHCIVALTHECDLCPDAASLDALMAGAAPPPRVTSTAINPHAMAQAEIDDAVKRSAASGLSLYAVDQAALLNARPTLVITQALCAVCAAATAEVDAVCMDIAQQLEANGDGIGSSDLQANPPLAYHCFDHVVAEGDKIVVGGAGNVEIPEGVFSGTSKSNDVRTGPSTSQ
jgi:hypothetical protein